MSTSDSSPKYTLQVKVDYEYKFLIEISVFNSDNRVIKPIENSLDFYMFKLKKGLYTVRVKLNADLCDTIIAVNSDKEYFVSNGQSQYSRTNIIEPPKQFSSALLEGRTVKTYASSHEYYTYPAIDFSKRDTFFLSSNIPFNKKSSLFIFLRFPSIEKYSNLRSRWLESFYKDFELINELGERIIHFESKIGIEVNEQNGWLAFNALLPNGIYYLIYHGAEPRQIPIYVFKNWHTQFFLTLGKEPLFGSARIFISKQREFNPKEETYKYIDILLDKLQNSDYSVDEELIKIAAYGKYESPMLGLICSYLYLKSPQTKNDSLFKIITQNLQNVILKDNDESPDIKALNILAAQHFDRTNSEETAVKGTPMLRIGFEAIQNAAIKNRNLIAKNSINDFISESLFYDSPFNTFKPIPYKLVSQFEIETDSFIKKDKDLRLIPYEPEKSIDDSLNEGVKSLLLEWSNEILSKEFSISIKDYLKKDIKGFMTNSSLGVESEGNWVRNSISDLLSKNENLSINDISNQLNLSGNTITRIFGDWMKEIKSKK